MRLHWLLQVRLAAALSTTLAAAPLAAAFAASAIAAAALTTSVITAAVAAAIIAVDERILRNGHPIERAELPVHNLASDVSGTRRLRLVRCHRFIRR